MTNSGVQIDNWCGGYGKFPITEYEMKFGSYDGSTYSVGMRYLINYPDGRTVQLPPQIGCKAGDFIEIIRGQE